MALAPQFVNTLPELQRLVPLVVKRANDDPAFGMRAASNPLLALEELGIQLGTELRRQVEVMVRFPSGDQERARELLSKLHTHLSDPFDAEQVAGLILTQSGEKKRTSRQVEIAKAAEEYRSILPRAMNLTSRESYETLKKEPPQTVVTRVRFVLRRSTDGKEET